MGKIQILSEVISSTKGKSVLGGGMEFKGTVIKSITVDKKLTKGKTFLISGTITNLKDGHLKVLASSTKEL